jgi:hypothetical protein
MMEDVEGNEVQIGDMVEIVEEDPEWFEEGDNGLPDAVFTIGKHYQVMGQTPYEENTGCLLEPDVLNFRDAAYKPYWYCYSFTYRKVDLPQEGWDTP